MIIYADITFINNFLMSLAIIWAVANIVEIKYKWVKLFSASFAATLYFFVVLFIQSLSINSFINVLLQFVLNIFAAVIIIKIAFPDLNRNRFIRAIGYLYLTTFISIGTILSFFYVYGSSPFDAGLQRIIIGIIVLIFIGNFGWIIFQKYKVPEEFYLSTTICFQDNQVNIIGLIDTGNSLNDPFTKAPVIVVDIEEVLSLLSIELQKELRLCKDDYVKMIDVLTNYGLGERVRILPFTDLGKENGIILGFRPDLIEIEYQDRVIKTTKAVIALSRRRLDVDNQYQALLHPQLIREKI